MILRSNHALARETVICFENVLRLDREKKLRETGPSIPGASNSLNGTKSFLLPFRTFGWRHTLQACEPIFGSLLHAAPPGSSTLKIPSETITDYYALLSLPRDASLDDINKAWRKLVLVHHPDKQLNGSNTPGLRGEEKVDIILVNEAKWVLSDPTRRREWEEAFFERGQVVDIPRSTSPHISHHISLADFTPHFTALDHYQVQDEEQEADYYSHACRCSGEFCITVQDLEDGVEIIGCEGCGEWVQVGYEVVEETLSDEIMG